MLASQVDICARIYCLLHLHECSTRAKVLEGLLLW